MQFIYQAEQNEAVVQCFQLKSIIILLNANDMYVQYIFLNESCTDLAATKKKNN